MRRTYIFFTVILFIGYLPLEAQLSANFTVDKTAGCSPLTVLFTNQTTGASVNAVYHWDFGNGNSSSLKNAGAIYSDEKRYTVTLTVTDGTKTSSKSTTITVFKKPTADFSVSIDKGCLPLSVSFTANATAGDGNIDNYLWDFGDGIVQSQAPNEVSHVYNFVQKATVNLVVTNSHGCYDTITKKDLVDIKGKLQADFTTDKTILCKETDPAQFTNTSIGSGALSYLWDFGDNSTSTLKNPSHAFNKKGSYTVTLTVTSSEGCAAVKSQTDYLNVANFTSDFSVPAVICQKQNTIFYNNSKPFGVAQSALEIDGVRIDPYYSNNGFLYVFANAGPTTVKMINNFGGCPDTISKLVTVNGTPDVSGFVADITGVCGSPVLVKFRDTTAVGVKWYWNFGASAGESTQQAPSYTYTYDNRYSVQLTVTNSAGCSETVYRDVDIIKPFIEITSPDVAPSGEIHSCGPVPIHFTVNTAEVITNYLWDFADGTTSTDPLPVHTYTKAGDYKVSLTYTTAKGCKGTVQFSSYVVVRNKVKADFTTATTNVCGNAFVTFLNTSSGKSVYYDWNFGDGWIQAFIGQEEMITHQFTDSGSYTIGLILTDGVCADTMIKTDYVKVLPPFPKIAGYTNTCDGTRGLVTFNQTSKYAKSWNWDFGDGSSLSLSSDEPQVQHLYNKTGTYKVVLSTTNGSCTVRDSMTVYVLLKQHPTLSIDKNEVCPTDDFLKVTYSNLEQNPVEHSSYGYNYGPWYHDDGSYVPQQVSSSDLSQMPFSHYMSGFTPGKEGMYALVQSVFFGCIDTTNRVPLKIKGPIAGFKEVNKPCATGNIAYLQDTSKAQNGIALTTWEWNFGDGNTVIYHNNAEVSHTYPIAGEFPVWLKVTDAGGCYTNVYQMVSAESNSLKASFNPSATIVSPGTTVSFTNTSSTSDIDHTDFQWSFGDGTKAITYDASKNYSQPGSYVVRLIAVNTLKGCADTMTTTIIVKYVNAAFSFNASFTNQANCPPVLVQFTNTSSNVTRIMWDFGDGSTSEEFNPGHIYTAPGKYIVIVKTYSDNGTSYATTDSVFVAGLSATIKSDGLTACTSKQITLNAKTTNGVFYAWDFGDGTVTTGTDTFSTHVYLTPGVYQPKLVVRNDIGCSVSTQLADKIIIDSLFIAMSALPSQICDSSQIFFSPDVRSIAADQAQIPLIYHWDFGTGNLNDTANSKNVIFNFNKTGTYNVKLNVVSPFGCLKETLVPIIVHKKAKASISGPAEICQGQVATFLGNASQNPVDWAWTFDNGNSSTVQSSVSQTFTTPGIHNIRLIVGYQGCYDTAISLLTVRANPVTNLSSTKNPLCLGETVQLTASGGVGYSWKPSTGLSNVNVANPVASPIQNTIYSVEVVDQFGCKESDSLNLTVIQPFQLNLPTDAFVCVGNSVQLNVQGAASYQWINNTSGLSNTHIGNPTASPGGDISYTVTGTDPYNCFKDTATVFVTVKPSPTVVAEHSVQMLTAESHQLTVTTSNDVVTWVWSPSDYLSCSDCPSPVTKPRTPIDYVVTVKNQYGCTASDSVKIILECSENFVFIPSGFTPNNDGKNDVFYIKGKGIRIIKSLKIFDRWGDKVFERTNFNIDDVSSAWDGKYKGLPVPGGAYVYIAEMQCDKGELIIKKGTVTVIY